ncbi:interleukin-15 receptor subunit alpha isoform X3 [Phacochoerus africanus]|uniref:interleukin-15 receptor subunit alpha isoform X3 n=1 Tax=Phacochoerus africanus TaxID=41426 RepID=UPI001FD9E33E|nr:interleukin-15 receptor subunit alpha isoform X3 [Phacochoerus africanus]
MAGPLRGCGAGALPVPLLLLLLLLLQLPRSPATPGVTCPPPTSVEHADIRVKSYTLNSRERYVCNAGFKRKAGTSSLTECVFNETMNVAHWTTPNLKCIRDPALTRQRPASTASPASPAGVAPEPESPTPSGKEPALTSKSDPTVSTPGPGSRLMPSKPPPAGTTGVVSNAPPQAPSQTTAMAPEHAGARLSPRAVVAVAVSTPCALLLCGACVLLLVVHFRRSRPTSQTPGMAMESMEVVPMTGGSDATGGGTES